MRRLIPLFVGFALMMTAVALAVTWFTCRIYVPHDMCAVLIRKTGEPLPSGQLVASKPGQKGIQEEVLGPGRHFRNPFTWDWKLEKQTVIPSGNPKTWDWMGRSRNPAAPAQVRAGSEDFKGEFPKLGVVVRKVGAEPPQGQVIVKRADRVKGILEEVLTPGAYKLNPYIFEVQLYPATVIPAGFVGVVTNLFGESPRVASTAARTVDTTDAPESLADVDVHTAYSRPLAEPGQRGTLRNVLQPGVYFINPKLQKVTPIEIGFNEYSQVKVSESENLRITFPSDTGYLIRVGVTVVWGIHPRHAAEVINEFGNVHGADGVLEKIIAPQLRSICRNIGSTYAARDFIQGEKRELFQKALTAELQRICRGKNIEVLLALVREIEVHAPGTDGQAQGVTEDLKRTIQQSYIAIEKRITKEKQQEAAAVKAQLEEVKKKIDIARETVLAQTRILVADTGAEGGKEAAQLDAQTALEVATIQQQVAQLDAQRTEILGQAKADIEKMKKQAEAEGYRMLVQAFGSAKAYNLYTFAQNFQPESIRLFYAGDGTFWTDLTRFEEVGAAKLLQPQGVIPR